MTPVWLVASMQSIPLIDGQQNVVSLVQWVCVLTTDNGSWDTSAQTTISYDGGSEFTPYDQLTQDEVIGWVKNELGPEGVMTVERSLYNRAATAEITPRPTPLPWG